MLDKDYTQSKKLVARDQKLISGASRTFYFPLTMKRGKGAIMEDLDGNRYIDLFSSSAVLNTGHNHPRVLEAIRTQLEDYIHFSADYMYSAPQVELAQRLTEITPGSFAKKVCFGFSGSDAIDGAIKLARAYTGRPKIVSFSGAYHGTTYGALSVSAIGLSMKRKVGPLLPDIYHLPYPNCYRCQFNGEPKTCSRECFRFLEDAFETYIPPDETAGILIEPIAGDIGFILPPLDYMQNLYAFCQKHGILFMVDEVQQGFGRTGKWFSIEHFGIEPDVLVLGKAAASGLPLSADVARAEIVDALEMPVHLFTLEGNATCCAASLATIAVIEEEGLMDNAVRIGDIIMERFREMQQRFPVIGDVRGIGLSIGVELVKDRTTREQDPVAAMKICYRLWQKGVVLIFLAGNVLRIQPPLVIREDEIREALDLLDEVIGEYSRGEIDDEALSVVQGW